MAKLEKQQQKLEENMLFLNREVADTNLTSVHYSLTSVRYSVTSVHFSLTSVHYSPCVAYFPILLWKCLQTTPNKNKSCTLQDNGGPMNCFLPFLLCANWENSGNVCQLDKTCSLEIIMNSNVCTLPWIKGKIA